MDILHMTALTGSILIFIFVLELIRRNKLKERYALLWLSSGIVLIILSLSREILHFLSRLFGVFYPPSFLFLIAFVFLLLINLHFSLVISGLTDKNKRLAQEIGLLLIRIEELEKAHNNKEK